MAIDRKYWQQALDVQSACNLSGVIFSFARAMRAICHEADTTNKGTHWKNTHPIAVLFSTQIGHLTGTSPFSDQDVWSAAYKHAQQMALSEEVVSEETDKAHATKDDSVEIVWQNECRMVRLSDESMSMGLSYPYEDPPREVQVEILELGSEDKLLEQLKDVPVRITIERVPGGNE